MSAFTAPDALYPALHMQWEFLPVLTQDADGWHLFLPEIGSQVLHVFGVGSGFGFGVLDPGMEHLLSAQALPNACAAFQASQFSC